MIPKYLPKKIKSRVQFWDDERSIGNSLIVTLAYGWRFDVGEHVRGFDTITEARNDIAAAEKCACEECLPELNK